jgi:hypothetical protein
MIIVSVREHAPHPLRDHAPHPLRDHAPHPLRERAPHPHPHPVHVEGDLGRRDAATGTDAQPV